MKAQQAVEESGVNGAVFRSPLDHYTGLIRDGTLREDEHQKAVLQTLDQLHKRLRGYSNTPTSFFSKVEKNVPMFTDVLSINLSFKAKIRKCTSIYVSI